MSRPTKTRRALRVVKTGPGYRSYRTVDEDDPKWAHGEPLEVWLRRLTHDQREALRQAMDAYERRPTA